MIFTETTTAVLIVALCLICLLHFRFCCLFSRDNSVQAFLYYRFCAVFLADFYSYLVILICSVCHFCNFISFEWAQLIINNAIKILIVHLPIEMLAYCLGNWLRLSYAWLYQLTKIYKIQYLFRSKFHLQLSFEIYQVQSSQLRPVSAAGQQVLERALNDAKYPLIANRAIQIIRIVCWKMAPI